jgi:hypothetical protein
MFITVMNSWSNELKGNLKAQKLNGKAKNV